MAGYYLTAIMSHLDSEKSEIFGDVANKKAYLILMATVCSLYILLKSGE
jgi:hypothetical protein